MGEKCSDLEQFYPDRMASEYWVWAMLALIEKAEAQQMQNKAKEMEQKLKKQDFDFNDF